MDVAVFNNAYAHQQIGEDPQARTLFLKLIKNHPSSPLVPDAYLSIGEICFKAREFQTALTNFQAIRKYPRARVYPYGLYKAAWSYYNLQDAPSGMTQLEEVIVFGRQVAAKKWDSKLDLRKEALGDLALFFSDAKQAKDAIEYFREQAQEIERLLWALGSKVGPAEWQSKLSRVHWAEGLIRQLPDHHDGRNSWLLNYSQTALAKSAKEQP